MCQTNSQSPKLDEIDVKSRISELTQSLLDEGVNPCEISYWMAMMSADMGLQLAPNPEMAFAVIFDALKTASETHAGDDVEVDQSSEIDIESTSSDEIIH